MYPTQQQGVFAQEVMRAIREQGDRRVLNYVPCDFALKIGDPPQLKLNLKRCYEDCCRSTAAQREAVIQRWIRIAVNTVDEEPALFDDCRPRLRLRIMQRSFAALNSIRLGARGRVLTKPAYKPLAADLDVCLAIDHGEATGFISADWLDRQGVNFDQAVRCALANRAGGTSYTRTQVNKVWMFTAENGYALADMLVDKRRREDLSAVNPVVLMPEQFTFMVASEDDVEALARMFELALQLPDMEYLGSSQPIVLRDDRWEPFKVPARLMPAFSKLRSKLHVAQFYSNQGELGRHFESQGSEEQFAQVLPMGESGADNDLMAICICDQTTLVPKVDFFKCIDAAGSEFYIKWVDVLRFSPESLEETEWPPFWRVKQSLYGPELREYASTKLPLAANAA